MKKHLFTLFALLAAAASLRGAVVLNEPFTYLDGMFLTNAPGGLWTIHSGSGFGPVIVGDKVLIAQTNSPDVSAAITGSPYSGPTLYVIPAKPGIHQGDAHQQPHRGTDPPVQRRRCQGHRSSGFPFGAKTRPHACQF
jgi:hypothetical protein